nr:sigma-70 family RNA polymerase sigma factor [Vibrio ostreicida]
MLSRVALRDRKAFEALYQVTSSKLYALIRSVVKDDDIAADLLQEGFVKLWYSDNRYPLEYPWAWLCQIMRNMAIDEVRKRNRRAEDILDPSLHEQTLVDDGTGTDSGLNHCLERLAQDKRNAIVLAYQHGMSHQEIVDYVKMPLGTVKSWIRRGLQELKRCLIE